MKITNVEGFVLKSFALRQIPVSGEDSLRAAYCCLIKVSTDEGITGWSDVEAAPESFVSMIEAIRALVVGNDPFETELMWDKVYRSVVYGGQCGMAMHVLSSLDIACHDIIGKAVGQPVYKLLGAGYRKKIRAYASVPLFSISSEIENSCEHYLGKGFTAIRLDLRMSGENIKRDIKLVKAARQTLGDDIELMVDAGWRHNHSAYDAVELFKQLEEYHIFWLEGFLHSKMLDSYAHIKEAAFNTKLAAGEQECTGWGFRRLIRKGCIDIALPNLSRCGGFTHFRKILWESESAGIDVCPQARLTELLTASGLHANSALPRSLFLEYNDSPMLHDIILNPIKMEADGTLAVPQAPGLGIEIDEKAMGQYLA